MCLELSANFLHSAVSAQPSALLQYNLHPHPCLPPSRKAERSTALPTSHFKVAVISIPHAPCHLGCRMPAKKGKGGQAGGGQKRRAEEQDPMAWEEKQEAEGDNSKLARFSKGVATNSNLLLDCMLQQVRTGRLEPLSSSAVRPASSHAHFG